MGGWVGRWVAGWSACFKEFALLWNDGEASQACHSVRLVCLTSKDGMTEEGTLFTTQSFVLEVHARAAQQNLDKLGAHQRKPRCPCANNDDDDDGDVDNGDDDDDVGDACARPQCEEEAYGLTLTHCTKMVVVEPILSELALQQVLGRIYRLGQAKETEAVFLVPRNTLHELMHERWVLQGLLLLGMWRGPPS